MRQHAGKARAPAFQRAKPEAFPHFGLDLKQPVIDEPPQQFRKVQTKQFRLNVEFVLELAIRSVQCTAQW
jgi:hypothetical protein